MELIFNELSACKISSSKDASKIYKIFFELVIIALKNKCPYDLTDKITSIGSLFLKESKRQLQLAEEKGIQITSFKASPIILYDVIMHVADAVISGGVRRSAVVCMFSKDDEEVMALHVKGRDIYGVQFHPESIMSEYGREIIGNFLNL